MVEKYGQNFLLKSLSMHEVAEVIADDLDNDYQAYQLHTVCDDRVNNIWSYHFEGYKDSTQKHYELRIDVKDDSTYPLTVNVVEEYDNSRVERGKMPRLIEIEPAEELIEQ
ncbi:hypothetical protein ACWA2C_28185 [Priestia megaterium]